MESLNTRRRVLIGSSFEQGLGGKESLIKSLLYSNILILILATTSSTSGSTQWKRFKKRVLSRERRNGETLWRRSFRLSIQIGYNVSTSSYLGEGEGGGGIE